MNQRYCYNFLKFCLDVEQSY